MPRFIYKIACTILKYKTQKYSWRQWEEDFYYFGEIRDAELLIQGTDFQRHRMVYFCYKSEFSSKRNAGRKANFAAFKKSSHKSVEQVLTNREEKNTKEEHCMAERECQKSADFFISFNHWCNNSLPLEDQLGLVSVHFPRRSSCQLSPIKNNRFNLIKAMKFQEICID